MNEMDLMNAMTDMEDDLLEMTPRRKNKGVVFFLVAALLALLVTGVSAAIRYGVSGASVDIVWEPVRLEGNNLSVEYNGTGEEVLDSLFILAKYDLKPQTITDTLYQQLSEKVTRAWKDNMEFAEKYNAPLMRDVNKNACSRVYQEFYPFFLQGPCFCRFCYLEEALGFSLVLTPQMQAAQRKSGGIPGQYLGDEKISFFVYYGNAAENCAAIEKNELLQPEGFSIWFLMGGYPEEEDHACCQIYLPLTEENAALQSIQKFAYIEKEGELKSEELRYGDIDVLMFYATPEPGYTGKAYAYYCVDGIGYSIVTFDKNGDGDARQMMLDLLDGLGEVGKE